MPNTAAVAEMPQVQSDKVMLEEVKALRAENARLQKQILDGATKRLHCKVSEKGGVSVYGLGQWPVTLYKSQWIALLAFSGTILAFIKANSASLSEKAKS